MHQHGLAEVVAVMQRVAGLKACGPEMTTSSPRCSTTAVDALGAELLLIPLLACLGRPQTGLKP